jgi:hypothetical protein
MKPTPIHVVHFLRVPTKIYIFSNIDSLITSTLDNIEQDDLATMIVPKILGTIFLSLVMVHDFDN